MLLQQHLKRCREVYLSNMSIGPNIRAIRESRGLKAVDVARHLGLDRSAYSKTEKGLRNVTVPELQAVAELFGCSMDAVVGYTSGDTIPAMIQTPNYADASAREQAQLIASLDAEDRAAIQRVIDKMLASKRFKEFYEQQLQSAA